MTFEDWTPLYGYLCAGLSRKEDGKQCRVYFEAVKLYPGHVVAEAVKVAVSRTWPPTHPHAGDLAECCTAVQRSRNLPMATCDRCQNVKFLITECAGWKAGQGQPEPVDRQRLCGRDFPHGPHEDAHPCPQCHMASRQPEAA